MSLVCRGLAVVDTARWRVR